MSSRKTERRTLVFAASLLVALGGLIYELLLGTASSYLFGDSITSFSIAIGTMLFGMGIGSLFSAKLLSRPARNFVWNELAISLLGGNAVLILFMAYNFTPVYWLTFIILSITIGIFIGMEIPLMVSIVKKYTDKSSEHVLTRILALDYIGALIASLIFPFILLPYLGVLRTSYVVALLNVVVAGLILFKLSKINKVQVVAWITVLILLLTPFVYIQKLEQTILTYKYSDPVVYMKLTPYQKIVLTKYGEDTKLFLNDHLQFSSLDEARYHETLVHSVMSSVDKPKKVAILGGGDGIAAKEVLKYQSVENIKVIDIDPDLTDLAKSNKIISAYNENSLTNFKVEVINQDAFIYIRDTSEKFDVVIIDLIDPSNERVAKLYSKELYSYVIKQLKNGGAFITQATSTYFTPNAFKTIVKTIEGTSQGRVTTPISVNVPSFGEWGFVMNTADKALFIKEDLPKTDFITSDQLKRSLDFPNDFNSDYSSVEISTLLSPKVYQIYNKDMNKWTY